MKVGVPPGYALPDLSGLVDGGSVASLRSSSLDVDYYDTKDLRLLRRGVTVRFRRGEPPGEVWSVKLPVGARAVGLARREVRASRRRGRDVGDGGGSGARLGVGRADQAGRATAHAAAADHAERG